LGVTLYYKKNSKYKALAKVEHKEAEARRFKSNWEQASGNL
jgi:hypothetical protein